MCVHSQVAQSPVVRQYFPRTRHGVQPGRLRADPQPRHARRQHRHLFPAGDVYPPLLALCGAAEVMNSRGAVRTILARELVLGKARPRSRATRPFCASLLPCPPNMRSARSTRSASGTRSRSPRSTSPSARLSKTAASRARAPRSARSRRTPTFQKTPRRSLAESHHGGDRRRARRPALFGGRARHRGARLHALQA